MKEEKEKCCFESVCLPFYFDKFEKKSITMFALEPTRIESKNRRKTWVTFNV